MWQSLSLDRVLSILGLLTGLYFYLRSRSLKRIDITQRVTWLQYRRHPEIRIYFREQEIEDLTRVRILVSNTGTLPLQPAQDFSARFAAGLQIAGADLSTKILSVALLGGDAEVSGATIAATPDGRQVVSRQVVESRSHHS